MVDQLAERMVVGMVVCLAERLVGRLERRKVA